MIEPRRRISLIAAAAAAGLLASAGQAPFGLWGLGLAGLALGFHLLASAATPRRAALAGWALGTGFFVGTLNWLTSPFLVEPEVYGWMAPFALLLMAGGLALFWALAAWGARRLTSGPGLWLVWAAAMGLAELVRGRIFTGFPWGGPGEFWVNTPLLGLAGLTGATGLGWLTFAFAAGLVAAWGSARRWLFLALCGVAAMVLAGAGALVLSLPVPEPAKTVTVRLIQPNAAQRLKWDRDFAYVFLDRAISLTAARGAGPAPDLVIWPETSVPYLL
ncbi:MAG TPA: apolipoprotein N-acyltransferase, partial [Rhodobacteraceae bacterium]|nr:apolipoprotein N-acyltransferase [Paracoccaceae bacterium]